MITLKSITKAIAVAVLAVLTVFPVMAQDLPSFNEPNSFVFDTEAPGQEKFSLLIKIIDYATDEKISVDVFGYGGKFKEEWDSLGTITLKGFSEEARVERIAGKMDYNRYRYFAIKTKSPSGINHSFTADQKNGNLNFYIWNDDADPAKNPMPTLSDHKNAYVFDAYKLGEKYSDDIYVKNNSKTDPLVMTVYLYNQQKHLWLVYGSSDVKVGKEKKLKAGGRYPLQNYRYFAVVPENADNPLEYQIFVKSGNINIVAD